MKRLLLLLPLALMLFTACSVEEETSLDAGENLTVVLENYKGVFTTLNGESRGKLDVTLSEDSKTAVANLTLSTGEVVAISTDQIVEVGNSKEISFSSDDLSFKMTTVEEGETMQLEEVTFRGSESSIIAGRNTERAPLSTVTGTYLCESCPAPLDNMDTQTFNVMFSSPSETDAMVTSQTTLGSSVYVGVATQSCPVGGSVCGVRSGTVPGTIGVAYTTGGGPVFWVGEHTFDNGPMGPDDCSTLVGNWQWQSPTLGTLNGTFASDVATNCPPPPTANFDPSVFDGVN